MKSETFLLILTRDEEIRKSITPEQMVFLKKKYGLTQATIDSLQDQIPGFKLDDETNALLNQADAQQLAAQEKTENDQNVKTKYTIIFFLININPA